MGQGCHRDDEQSGDQQSHGDDVRSWGLPQVGGNRGSVGRNGVPFVVTAVRVCEGAQHEIEVQCLLANAEVRIQERLGSNDDGPYQHGGAVRAHHQHQPGGRWLQIRGHQRLGEYQDEEAGREADEPKDKNGAEHSAEPVLGEAVGAFE